MNKSIAKIAVPAPLYRLFDYRIPESLQGQVAPGMRVQVPFGRQKKIGIVVEVCAESDWDTLKDIDALLDQEALLPKAVMELILWGARHYLAPPGEAFRAVLPAPFWKPTKRRHKIKPPPAPASYHPKKISYSEAQEEAIARIWNDIKSRGTACCAPTKAADVFLLHGITGSGKTEVYLEVARRVLEGERSVLFLVPEIALTPQLLGRCAAELPAAVLAYHSGMTPRQRQELWEQCQRGEARVIVGTRSALFLPLQNLGLLVVDEEHDSSFKQEERFRYNARDLAIVRARMEAVPVILGSATPSLESLQRCREGKYQYLQLPKRVGGGELPELRFVDLAQRERPAQASLITAELLRELDENLQRGEQSILFLNRRGFSPVQLCQDCGNNLQCPHCHISLTFHKRRGHSLCHYCLHEQSESPVCVQCGSSRVIWVGWGTERIEEELRVHFPRARIARLDRDTTRRKGSLEATLEQMRHGEIDILLGTQMLTKGHDYANVTLVGVLLAESSLNFPDFRAGERTFQMITQVAGRAGRGTRPGRVLVQGFQPNHYVMRTALQHDFASFADRELGTRQQLDYPPFQRLLQWVFRAPSQQLAQSAARNVAQILAQRIGNKAQILGPAPCPIEKLRSQYRWQLLIKTRHYAALGPILQAYLDADLPNVLPSKVSLAVDVDPLNML